MPQKWSETRETWCLDPWWARHRDLLGPVVCACRRLCWQTGHDLSEIQQCLRFRHQSQPSTLQSLLLIPMCSPLQPTSEGFSRTLQEE